MPPAHRRLRDHLRSQVGDALRSIVYYDADSQQVVYLRDDVSAAISDAQARGLVDFLREREDIAAARRRMGLDGDLRCNVHCWEDRIGIHFVHGPDSGTLVALEPSVSRELHAFAGRCEELLDGV